MSATSPNENPVIEHGPEDQIPKPQDSVDIEISETASVSKATIAPGDPDQPVGESPDEHERDLASASSKPKKRRRRKVNPNAVERNLLGRRALCKKISEIAPNMLKTVKLRVLSQYLNSTKGLDDNALVKKIQNDSSKLAAQSRILDVLESIDPEVDRRNLKEIIIFSILLQEETHSLEESKLEQKVIEFEKELVKKAKVLDFFDPKKHDPKRWHHYDTYRIVLDAAWKNKDDISYDEASLLKVLRGHLNISHEEHWLIGCYLKRFPKKKCSLHTPDEIHDARKKLQKESILWSYRDQNNKNIDVIPIEIVDVIRKKISELELQEVNYCRMVEHDAITVKDLRKILSSHEMDTNGVKADLVDRIISSDIKPSAVLDVLEKTKISDMCRLVGLKYSGKKEELIKRLIEFYDDLTFEERETQDDREVWYNNYELLATRSYSDLRAKKVISKDLDIEHQFEKATDFLFEVMLNVSIDNSRKITKADGRIPLNDRRVIIWDCKSVESELNLQEYLESQFDLYVRKETAKGNTPLAVLVIAPKFTSGSLKLAYRYKAQTNVDVALVEADALKHLAERWSEMEPNNQFPVTLFNRTELLDKDRMEFLLSLA